jgi:hypothetical protein
LTSLNSFLASDSFAVPKLLYWTKLKPSET